MPTHRAIDPSQAFEAEPEAWQIFETDPKAAFDGRWYQLFNGFAVPSG
jgi:hypothetical protein